MMTTMAALLGGQPLMLGTGTGSEIRRPLGFAIVGGLGRQPILDALHDARGLPLPRSPAPLVQRRARDNSLASAGDADEGVTFNRANSADALDHDRRARESSQLSQMLRLNASSTA